MRRESSRYDPLHESEPFTVRFKQRVKAASRENPCSSSWPYNPNSLFVYPWASHPIAAWELQPDPVPHPTNQTTDQIIHIYTICVTVNDNTDP